jgi:hypothetical protein
VTQKSAIHPKKTQHPWLQLLDTKHYFIHVKFQVRFVISFTRNPMFNKKRHFSWRCIRPFPKAAFEQFQAALFCKAPQILGLDKKEMLETQRNIKGQSVKVKN